MRQAGMGVLLWVVFALGPLVGTIGAALPPAPTGDDYTHTSLRRYQQQFEAVFGNYRNIPLELKAEYFTWELWRYHLTSFDQVYHRALLPDQPGAKPQIFPDRDCSTWSGAYLAALSYEYAVTRSPQKLEQIVVFLRGLHFFFQVTGVPGLPARCVNRADGVIEDARMKAHPYTTPDGTQYFYEADPAKGGFNQIAGGYAVLMMLVYPDLPPESQRLVRQDITDFVLHIIDHNYKATNADGTPATYGDLTPLIGAMGVPFNAQVAYEIVALGYSFPPDDAAARRVINEQFVFLRGKHHVYYEEPWRLVQPQRIGGSSLVKGMNDRNHVTNAAFVGLFLELDFARRTNTEYNAKFMYELGQTMVNSLSHPDMERNALDNFMFAGITRDPAVLDCLVPNRKAAVQAEIQAGLANGVEQLRRYKLDRFVAPGKYVETPELQWIDTFRADDYYWKENPRLRYDVTGPETNQCFCAADYLHAYWLWRYFQLDKKR